MRVMSGYVLSSARSAPAAPATASTAGLASAPASDDASGAGELRGVGGTCESRRRIESRGSASRGPGDGVVGLSRKRALLVHPARPTPGRARFLLESPPRAGPGSYLECGDAEDIAPGARPFRR